MSHNRGTKVSFGLLLVTLAALASGLGCSRGCGRAEEDARSSPSAAPAPQEPPPSSATPYVTSFLFPQAYTAPEPPAAAASASQYTAPEPPAPSYKHAYTGMPSSADKHMYAGMPQRTSSRSGSRRGLHHNL